MNDPSFSPPYQTQIYFLYTTKYIKISQININFFLPVTHLYQFHAPLGLLWGVPQPPTPGLPPVSEAEP